MNIMMKKVKKNNEYINCLEIFKLIYLFVQNISETADYSQYLSRNGNENNRFSEGQKDQRARYDIGKQTFSQQNNYSMDILKNQRGSCCQSRNIQNQHLHDKIRERALMNAEELIQLVVRSQENGNGEAMLKSQLVGDTDVRNDSEEQKSYERIIQILIGKAQNNERKMIALQQQQAQAINEQRQNIDIEWRLKLEKKEQELLKEITERQENIVKINGQLDSQKVKSKEEMDELSKQIDSLNSKLKEKERYCDEAKIELAQQSRQRQEDIAKLNGQLENSKVKSREEMDELRKQIDSLSSKLKDKERQHEESKTQLAKQSGQLVEFQQNCQIQILKTKKMEQITQSTIQEQELMKQQNQKLNIKLQEAEKTKAETDAYWKSLQSNQEQQAQQKNQEYERVIVELKNQIKSQSQEIQNQKEQLQTTAKQAAQFKEELELVKKEKESNSLSSINKNEATIDSLKKELSDSKQAIVSYQEEARQSKEVIYSLQEQLNSSLKELQKQKLTNQFNTQRCFQKDLF